MDHQGQLSLEKTSSCLARQPILAQDEKVLGYELLFQEAQEDAGFASDGERATSDIIDTLNVIGLDVVCDGRLAFIKCTQRMLLQDHLLLLPSDKVVAEIQENVPANQSVIEACRRLKERNYRIALDNFGPNDPRIPLLPLADFIKVDTRSFSPAECASMAALYGTQQRRMVAQTVRTHQDFLAAANSGFTLFQGYYFRRSERMRARHIPASQASYLRLLQAISKRELDLEKIEYLIKHDVSLCYRLLRYMNSPLLGVASSVQSVRHAMNLLGERELVKWIRMATTLLVGQDKCSDLVLSSLVRARFCELLAPRVGQGESDLFLMGMLSLMDAILELPMGVVVEGLPLDPNIKAELLSAKRGGQTVLSHIYDLMVAREAGDWEEVVTHAKKINLSVLSANKAYNDAIVWAHRMTTLVPLQDDPPSPAPANSGKSLETRLKSTDAEESLAHTTLAHTTKERSAMTPDPQDLGHATSRYSSDGTPNKAPGPKRSASPNLGRHVWGLGAITLGLAALVWGGLLAGWQPIAPAVPYSQEVACIVAIGFLAGGAAIEWHRRSSR